MGKYKGLFEDTFLEVEAIGYEDAMKKMRELMIKLIQEDEVSIVIYDSRMDVEE